MTAALQRIRARNFLPDLANSTHNPEVYAEGHRTLSALCQRIEMAPPTSLQSLYTTTQAAVQRLNALLDRGVPIDARAREQLVVDFCLVAQFYGYEGLDAEQLVAGRAW